MKVRIGFVSNSSSSSFVIVGVPIKNDIMEQKFGKDFYDVIEDQGFYYTGEIEVFGILIATGASDGDSFPEMSIPITDLQEHAQKIADFLGIAVSEVRFITGEMAC